MDEEQGTIEYLVEVDLGSNGGCLRAREIDDLDQWVARERESWKWLFDGKPAVEIQPLVKYVSTYLDQLNTAFLNLKNEMNPGRKQEFVSIVEDVYANCKMLHSNTADAKFIEDLREQWGATVAAAAIAMRLNRPLTLHHQQQPRLSAEVLRGSVRMIMFLAGVDAKTPEIMHRDLQILLDSCREGMNETAKHADELQHRLDRLVTEHTEMRERGLASMVTAVRLARSQARQQRSEAEDRLMSLEKIYNDKLSLDAPVDYWRRKGAKHIRLAKVFFSTFAVLLLIGIALGSWIAGTTRLGTWIFGNRPILPPLRFLPSRLELLWLWCECHFA